jgi:glyoxylase I family protein
MTSQCFSHIALNCRDMQATEQFYARYFGFQRARVVDLGADQIVFLKLGSVYLELFQAQGINPAAAPEKDGSTWPGIRHIAFQVENVDATLLEIGEAAPISLGPFSFDEFIPGWRTVWIRDPDGNIVEISQGFVDQESPPQLEALATATVI